MSTTSVKQKSKELKIKVLDALQASADQNNITVISAFILSDILGIHYSATCNLIDALVIDGVIEILAINGTYDKKYTIQIFNA